MVFAVMAAAGMASAQSGGPARFRAIDDTSVTANPSRLLSASADRPVKMVVVMSEPSVAGARALSPTLRISNSERDAVVKRVRAQHAEARPRIEARGAKVLQNFHGAINGISVQVKPSQVASLLALPGVLKVLPAARHEPNNTVSVPYIGTPAVWQGLPGLDGFRGEHVKVAIIDTGIDYTHANFGGPGTVAAFAAAAANSTGPADPSLFGPNAPKVKGGIDLVGDNYDANVPGSVPVPDANPLDCGGHGSHVAGTVAGFGVTTAGATYHGPYTAASYTATSFGIGPGVAPKADLYAVRVFGCEGSTNMVVEAIEWAINNDMDVINMSLGLSFGSGDTADALAATSATRAGVVVVASAGNSGPIPYITGSPASGDGVLSVAAIDGRPSFPGATVTLASGTVINSQNANGAALPAAALPVVVLRNADGSVSLGCSAAEYAGTAGKLVVTKRGTCARVDRATFGQAAGAAAVAMINNGPGFGIYEGPIPGVSIPFLGIQPSDAAAITASASAKLVSTTLNNAFAGTAASFSSGGPRVGDSALKPAVSAPGVSVFSTLVGSGNGSIAESGTSMAAPHVAGVAALTTQAHPRWSASELTAAIAQTADASKLPDYAARIEGAGLVQPRGATLTQAIVSVDGDPAATALSFGFAEFTGDFRGARTLKVQNKGQDRISFSVAATATGGSAHSVKLNRTSLSLQPGESTTVQVQLDVPLASAGDSSTFNEVAGLIRFTPTSAASNAGVALTVPYYLVQRARSILKAEFAGDPSALTVKLSNEKGAAANADFYALGLVGNRQGAAPFDIHAVGVQSFPLNASNNLLVFAVNTFDRFNTSAIGEVDIYIDSDGDGNADYVVYNTTSSASGAPLSAVVNLKTGRVSAAYYAIAPTDGSTLLLPVRTSDIGLSRANPRMTYVAYGFNSYGAINVVPGVGRFNAFSPAISNGDYVTLPAGGRTSVPVVVNAAEQALTPALGVLVVNQENNSGAPQGTVLRLGR
jgi:subtilisin family serine protease